MATMETHVVEWILGAAAVLLLGSSALLWMLRPAARLAAGDPAPDFALADQDGRVHRLGDYAGRWLVVYFYPRDDTPHCTREACSFRDATEALAALGAAVVGVSVDSPASHAAFARKHRLAFPLLADPGGRTAAAFGSLLRLGILRVARRRSFIIAPDGHIAARFDRVDPLRHADEVAGVLRRLQQAARSRSDPQGRAK